MPVARSSTAVASSRSASLPPDAPVIKDFTTNTGNPTDHITTDRTLIIHGAAEPGDAGLPGGSALITHPRHDFDAINFRAGALAADGPWSFSPVGLAEARTRGGPGDERRSVPFLDGPLPPRATDDRRGAIIELAGLHRFLDGPPAAFLAQRLGVGLPRHEELGDELHPVEVDPLHKYQLHTELLEATWSVGDLDVAHAQWASVALSLIHI